MIILSQNLLLKIKKEQQNKWVYDFRMSALYK